MPNSSAFRWVLVFVGFLLAITVTTPIRALFDEQIPGKKPAGLDPFVEPFNAQVKPLLQKHCYSCHGSKKKEASLDLTQEMGDLTQAQASRHLEQVIERIEAKEMPPEESVPLEEAEHAVLMKWLRAVRDREIEKTAGDPGPVLARRLSNAEYDYTIRDLTGIDIRPTKEFPVDPANESGFDNSGESLTMSPALLKKYLAASRLVADHLVLKPDGLVFAPHPVVTDTDRDKYCVKRIIDFYLAHNVDLADYFLICWKFKHREHLDKKDRSLETLAREAKLSPAYCQIVWKALTEGEEPFGPLALIRNRWNALGERGTNSGEVSKIRQGSEKLRDLVIKLRKPLKADIKKVSINGLSAGSQPVVLWNNKQSALSHRSYGGDSFADLKKLADVGKNEEKANKALLEVERNPDNQERLKKSLTRFCETFPDSFFVSDRGPYFNPGEAGKGRLLTAGFHLMQGYFRDDIPLMEIVLDEKERGELNALWQELNFVTLVPMRQYADFIFFERAEPPSFMSSTEFDFARSEDKDANSEAKMKRLCDVYLAKAVKNGAKGDAVEAIRSYFFEMEAEIRRVEKARLAAEPAQLQAMLQFASKAFRRPLLPKEGEELLAFYRKLRTTEELGHEEAIRDTIAAVLLSPKFLYRYDLESPPIQDVKTVPLSDLELASRLSYFLWSSMPDTTLLAHASSGDLHRPEVLLAETRRMLLDPRVRGLAVEFGGNFLDFRRFEEHNSVDRQRFPTFTNELRQSMFEEPVRYFMDLAQHNRSVLDLIHGKDTFVDRLLAKHYNMPEPKKGGPDWVHVDDADKYGRGGILPMAVFQTKNAPGLRTSPVKRGYWVVRKLLGEQIPPPPPTVAELPKEETASGEKSLPQLLAQHRDNKACAGCHRRFDSVGLVFENFGPVGDLRTKDLGGRPVILEASFPDGKNRTGVKGLQEYLKEKREGDFLNNFSRKLFSYALGRSLMLSDRKACDQMMQKWKSDNYSFQTLVEGIVLTPQFLQKRGKRETSTP